LPKPQSHPDNSKELDHDLLKRIAASDQLAYRILFNRYYKLLLGTAINIIKDLDSGKDAVQEVFLQLWKNRESLVISSSLEAYLKRAVINRVLSILKKEQRFDDDTVLLNKVEKSADVSEILEGKDMERIISDALEKVPERSRVVFILKRQEGLSVKEIASQLNISPKTVENQITKALKILKEAVKPYVDHFNNSS
jgi:RNA polymerase sigma-70 factor (ECF subfamily)